MAATMQSRVLLATVALTFATLDASDDQLLDPTVQRLAMLEATSQRLGCHHVSKLISEAMGKLLRVEEVEGKAGVSTFDMDDDPLGGVQQRGRELMHQLLWTTTWEGVALPVAVGNVWTGKGWTGGEWEEADDVAAAGVVV